MSGLPAPPSTHKLAAEIAREHQAALAAACSAVEHAIRCGELLIQAKDQLPHGGWLPWLEANTTISARQSQRYMRLAAHADELIKNDAAAHLIDRRRPKSDRGSSRTA